MSIGKCSECGNALIFDKDSREYMCLCCEGESTIKRLKKRIELLDEYAYLLRIAWCNPSDEESQMNVSKFENIKHAEELYPLLDRWHRKFYGKRKKK